MSENIIYYTDWSALLEGVERSAPKVDPSLNSLSYMNRKISISIDNLAFDQAVLAVRRECKSDFTYRIDEEISENISFRAESMKVCTVLDWFCAYADVRAIPEGSTIVFVKAN
ncbi:MAG: hypothetical protein JXR97_15995 [Planctomycetes bacterium]|nr:hypothetical protein [Planctomycetota bacterium]